MGQRKGGIIQIQVDGVMFDAKGEFTHNLGGPKRKAIVGTSTVHGFTEEPQVPFIEGKITDRGNLDVKALINMTDATVTLTLANEKAVSLRQGWYAADGNVTSAEGEVEFRFEGIDADEV